MCSSVFVQTLLCTIKDKEVYFFLNNKQIAWNLLYLMVILTAITTHKGAPGR